MTSVSSFELLLRLGLSFAVVLGLILGAAKFLRNKPGFGRDPKAPKFDVLDRISVGRSSSVALVRLGGRGLVVGITDGSITLLTEAPELIETYEEIEAQRTESQEASNASKSPRTNFLQTLRELTVKKS
ncbi:MAG: flagellar biosynthetic protein FliO [Acidimicrobiia bacterium]